ncbi:MAG: TolC family protein [Robiginitomaculum sp.]|nr:TolC family protein [Robiginitomaculum sp.]
MKNLYLVLLSTFLTGLISTTAPTVLAKETEPALLQSSRPVVAEFVQSVLISHPALNSAKAELDATIARGEGSARAIYNPELEVEFESSAATTKAVGISQTIDWSGKRKANAATGKSDVQAAKAALEIVKKTITTDLLSALADHQSAFDQIQLERGRFRLAEEFLDLATKRHDAGDLSQSELLTARLTLSQAVAAKAQAQDALSRSRQKLAALVGSQRDVWPILVGTPQTQLLYATDTQVNTLPELRFALAQSDGFRSRILLADKMRKADPTIGLRIGQESEDLGGQATLFGVQIAIPLQIRNNYSQNVTAARAEAVAAAASAQNTRRQVMARLNATTKRVIASQQAWSQWQDTGATQLDLQRELLKTLWQAGETDAVSYLVQLNQTFDAEAASIELTGALWRNWFEWLDASNNSTLWLEAIR